MGDLIFTLDAGLTTQAITDIREALAETWRAAGRDPAAIQVRPVQLQTARITASVMGEDSAGAFVIASQAPVQQALANRLTLMSTLTFEGAALFDALLERAQPVLHLTAETSFAHRLGAVQVDAWADLRIAAPGDLNAAAFTDWLRAEGHTGVRLEGEVEGLAEGDQSGLIAAAHKALADAIGTARERNERQRISIRWTADQVLSHTDTRSANITLALTPAQRKPRVIVRAPSGAFAMTRIGAISPSIVDTPVRALELSARFTHAGAGPPMERHLDPAGDVVWLASGLAGAAPAPVELSLSIFDRGAPVPRVLSGPALQSGEIWTIDRRALGIFAAEVVLADIDRARFAAATLQLTVGDHSGTEVLDGTETSARWAFAAPNVTDGALHVRWHLKDGSTVDETRTLGAGRHLLSGPPGARGSIPVELRAGGSWLGLDKLLLEIGLWPTEADAPPAIDLYEFDGPDARAEWRAPGQALAEYGYRITAVLADGRWLAGKWRRAQAHLVVVADRTPVEVQVIPRLLDFDARWLLARVELRPPGQAAPQRAAFTFRGDENDPVRWVFRPLDPSDRSFEYRLRLIGHDGQRPPPVWRRHDTEILFLTEPVASEPTDDG